MVDPSPFRGVIDFLAKIGVYDVILPFLLVFTIVFAILDKTKILGTDKVGDKTSSKKNLNSMVAFVIALLVVASAQLVAVINQVVSQVVLLLVLIICFLLLVGTFFGSEEFTLKEFPTWVKFLMTLSFIGIVLIFLNALDWLQYIFYLFQNWDLEWASTIIFVIIIVAFMWYVVKDPTPKKEKKE
jgi:hypothetical protein